MKFLSRS